MATLALADMIEELRREIAVAVERGKDEEVRFELGEVTLEANVEVKYGAEGKAGWSFWVFTSAEAAASVERGTAHKVALTLRPKGSDGSPVDLEG